MLFRSAETASPDLIRRRSRRSERCHSLQECKPHLGKFTVQIRTIFQHWAGCRLWVICAARFCRRARPIPVLSSGMFRRRIVCRCWTMLSNIRKKTKKRINQLGYSLVADPFHRRQHRVFSLVVARVGSKCRAKHRPGCRGELSGRQGPQRRRHLSPSR